jgi:hypothetical protein
MHENLVFFFFFFFLKKKKTLKCIFNLFPWIQNHGDVQLSININVGEQGPTHSLWSLADMDKEEKVSC